MEMRCPECHLLNPSDALACSCGFRFVRRHEREGDQAFRICLRLSTVLVVFAVILVTLVSPLGQGGLKAWDRWVWKIYLNFGLFLAELVLVPLLLVRLPAWLEERQVSAFATGGSVMFLVLVVLIFSWTDLLA